MWTPADLHRLLDRPLGDDPVSGTRTVVVHELVQRDAALEFDVAVTDRAAGVHDQRWHLAFATMWRDIHELPLDAARIIVRANLEEWWDTRRYGDAHPGLRAHPTDPETPS